MQEEEVQDFYNKVLDVAKVLDPDSGEKVIDKFGIKAYPNEDDDNKNDFTTAAYGFSHTLAESFHEKTGDMFYQNTSDRFEQFVLEAEGKEYASCFNQSKYIQIVNLYSKIAEDSRSIEYNPPGIDEIVKSNLSGKKDIVLDMLEDLSDELT